MKITRLILIILFMLTGCSQYQWKQPIHRSAELPLVFDKQYMLGTGLKLSDLGFVALPCLKSFESSVAGGKTGIEFRRITIPFQGTSSEEDHFIRQGIERAARYNRSEHDPVSFILKLTVTDRITEVREETIRFREDVEKLIFSHNKERFYQTCGTEFVHAVRFDSSVMLFFTIYPKTADTVKALESKLKERIHDRKDDVLQLGLFKGLNLDTDSFFSLRVDTNTLFEPVEFVFNDVHGKGIDDFLKSAMAAALNSHTGEPKEYFLSSWTKLNDIRDTIPLSGDVVEAGHSDELVIKSLQLLENSVWQFRLRYAQLKAVMAEDPSNAEDPELTECQVMMSDASRHITWESYGNCRYAAISNKTVDLQFLDECEDITRTITDINLSKKCLSESIADISDRPWLSLDAYQPAEMADRLVPDAYSIHRKETGYRFNDREQVEEIPEPVSLGQGMDWTGKRYDGNCIVAKTRKTSGTGKSGNYVVTNDHFPLEITKDPLIWRILTFWKDSPEWTFYRGSVEIEATSPVLFPNFEISKEAEALAKDNIVQFFETCGTHFVDQIKHRRGFVYYFSPDEAGDAEIKVIPFGMKKLPPPFPVSYDLLEGIPVVGEDDYRVCHIRLGTVFLLPLFAGSGWQIFFGLGAGLVCYDNLPPLMKPESGKMFFKNKKKVVMLFKDDSEAVPVRLSLFPWSEYLLSRGILTQQQLDPTLSGEAHAVEN